jgi:transposase
MLEILKDNFRPGCPSTFSDLQKKQIITMACKKPSEYNIPRTKWTHELLAAIAIEEKIVKSISSRHIGDILKKGGGSST